MLVQLNKNVHVFVQNEYGKSSQDQNLLQLSRLFRPSYEIRYSLNVLLKLKESVANPWIFEILTYQTIQVIRTLHWINITLSTQTRIM